MSEKNITVKSPKTDREVTFTRDFGSTVAESIELYGENVVFSIFESQAIIRAQAAARTCLDKLTPDGLAAHTVDEAITAGEAYTPGVSTRAVRGTGKKKAYSVVAEAVADGSMTMEQLQQLIAEKKAQIDAETEAEEADDSEE